MFILKYTCKCNVRTILHRKIICQVLLHRNDSETNIYLSTYTHLYIQLQSEL